ncbi:MAG: WD40 repeat domain-containing protein [Hydrococcus sp. C42_A2020_068]|nr:WD40 repeat domain-containing protein [Hydrococcus sp. C42_A2020_068]
MLLKQHHWLEIAEYLAVAMTLIGLSIAIATGNLFFLAICLSIALVLNLINRLRFQHLSRKRLSGTIKQLQQQLFEEIQAIAERERNATRTTSTTPTNAGSLTAFQESLLGLERAIDSIACYLNSHTLPERIEQLEKSYEQLRQQIPSLANEQPTASPPSPSFSLVLPRFSSPPTTYLSNWTCIHTLNAHAEAVVSLAIGSDGRFLASASWDRTIKLWELATGRSLAPTVGHSQAILAVIFIENEDEDRVGHYQLATGSFDRAIKIWSLVPEEEGKINLRLERTLTDHSGSIHALAVAAKRRILISGSYDQTVKQWDLTTGKMLKSSYDDSGAIYAIAVNESAQIIASGGGDGRVTLWQLETGEELCWLTGNISSVESLSISPDGRVLAAGCIDGQIKLWQLEPGLSGSQQLPQPPLPIRILHAHVGQVKSLAFSPDGLTLFSSGADGTIKTWHPNSMEAVDAIAISDDSTSRLTPVCSLAISADGQFLAAGSADGKIKVWQRN